MAQVWGMWHGGASYAVPSVDETEAFDSLEHAQQVMRDRIANRDGYTPVVSGSSMHVFLSDPRDAVDPYPDYVLEQDDNDDITVTPA